LAQGGLMRFRQLSFGVGPRDPLIFFQLTGALGAWAAVPIAQLCALNLRSPSAAVSAVAQRAAGLRWLQFIAGHLLGYLGFSAVHIALIRGLRWGLLRMSLVTISDGTLSSRILWEVQNDMVVYAAVAAIFTMQSAWRERDEAGLRASRLEARLAEAQLDALAAQVDPHFFYNALNTISATMYENLPQTERYLTNLATIMRATLRHGERTWTLDEERAHTERYLELQLARFGPRLRARWAQDAAIGGARLPRFAVQTLVENALKHNARRREPLTIEIALRQSGAAVELVVADDGSGFGSDALRSGRGLSRLAETLRLLHGAHANLECGSNPGGGARVRVSLPYVVS
jgi:two-component system, LytTR family, sensor kinase